VFTAQTTTSWRDVGPTDVISHHIEIFCWMKDYAMQAVLFTATK